MDLSILKNKIVQLSAVMSTGNFFYAYYDRTNKDIFIKEEKVSSISDLRSQFQKIQAEAKEFSFRIYKSKFALCPSSIIWVPRPMYDPKNTNIFLKNFFSPSLLEKSVVQQDVLDDLDSFGMYLIPNDWHQAIQSFDPAPIIRHSLSALIQFCLRNIETKNMVLGLIEKNRIQIVVKKNGQLMFSNVFECQNSDAYVYFLNLVYQLHDFSRDHCPLYLAGAIAEKSELYELIYRYFRYVHLTVEGMNYKFRNVDSELHRYINIHATNLCE